MNACHVPIHRLSCCLVSGCGNAVDGRRFVCEEFGWSVNLDLDWALTTEPIVTVWVQETLLSGENGLILCVDL